MNQPWQEAPFFGDGGEIRSLLHTHDWSTSPLGHPHTWPVELVHPVQLMLNSGFPAVIAWGPNLGLLYNDAYIDILGDRHPRAFGCCFEDVWNEAWPELLPIFKTTLAGKPSYFEDMPYTLMRGAVPETRWFTSSYSPIYGNGGSVAGIYNTTIETTSRVVGERRQAFQLALADRLRPLTAPDDITAAASELLGMHLGASRVLYAEVDDPRGCFIIRRDWISIGAASVAGEVRVLNDFGPEVIAQLRSGEVLAVDDVALDLRTREQRGAYEKIGIRAHMAIPLVKSGRLTAILGVHLDRPRHWTEADISLSQDMAERTWSAVESTRAQAELRFERDQSQSIFDSMAEGFALLDRDWIVLRMNAEGLRLVKRNAAEVIGHNHWSVWPELCGTDTEILYKRVKVTGVAGIIENFYTFPEGGRMWVEVRAYPTHDGGLAVFFRDVTQRRCAEDAVREQTEKLQLAAELAGLGLFDHNLPMADVSWDARMREQFGIPAQAEITEATLYERVHPEDRERVRNILGELNRKGENDHFQAEYRILTMQGSQRWISTRGKAFLDAEGRPIRLVGTTMDITQRKRAERQIQEAAQHDSLTGLPNRALLYEYCGHILARSSRMHEAGAILFIDLDRFKPINDIYGHDVGDKVLKEVAQRIQAHSRKEDLVSRLGGDEFIVVLPHICSPDDTIAFAGHLRHVIGAPMLIDTHQLTVSPSIGISLFPDHGNALEPLIRCADMAMYAAKNDGRNSVRIYSAGLSDYANGLLRLEILLKQALENQRLALFYQPILDVQSGNLISVEALVRIPSENGTLLEPTRFIQIAETAGLVSCLGEWVIRQACRQQREWLEAALPPVTIAVNVSPTQFRQSEFVSMLESVVQEFSVEAARLQIEVTESTVMDNVPETVATLNRLQSMGIKIALDDFGTGYSSLSHLSSLPLNKLKIDQSFIFNMGSDRNSRAITEAIIGLGHSLNLKVVGEGVESKTSMDLLRGYGCDQVQGFFFSKPLPPSEFECWYLTHLRKLDGA
jgi:diguanylate cyclase (GGDEF)-like protein/PAS domain S-box-containing protein